MQGSSNFRAYDIRGIYGQDLDESVANNVGKAVGTFAGKGKKIGVARDVRLSSKALHDALVSGILSSGCDVLDFGEAPTPLLYFGTWHEKLSMGVMVTASHLPPEWNGFKISGPLGVTLSDGTGLEKIRDIYERHGFTNGQEGKSTKKDIVKDYIDFVASHVRPAKRFRVAVDFANSVTSLVVPKLLERLGQTVVPMNMELDGTSPNRASEPSEDSLQGLKKTVLAEKADLGIGYDGDGDRVAFVDEEGRIFASGNTTIPLFAAKMVRKGRNDKVVVDVTCSSAVSDYIKGIGGEALVVRVGHSYCANAVIGNKALFGGQYSGHLAFPEMNCADDAIFPSMKMLEILSTSNKKMSQLIDAIPAYFTSKMVEISCPDSRKFGVMEEIKRKARSMGYKLIDIDGVLLYDENGRVLIRASNTAPIIRVNSEGKTEQLRDKFQKIGEKLVLETIKV